MALFEVDGWNLKTTNVKVGGKENKSNRKRKQKEAELSEELSGLGKSRGGDVPAQDVKNKKAKKNKSSKKDVSTEKSNDTRNEPKDIMKEDTTPSAPPQLDLPSRKLTPLQQKMMAKLTGSRFRWINEQLYTITSDAALKLVKEQPSIFDEYHDGFRSQVKSWPENPVDVFVNEVKGRSQRPVNAPGGLPGLQKDKKVVIADMGCGEAQFAADIQKFLKERNGPKKGKGKKHQHRLDIDVHSFDLKKANERITVADIRNVPMEDNSCTVVIFCLALMGTNFLDFIQEAYRILAPNGELWIAEIKSRFSDKEGKGDEFVNALKLMGFFHKKTDDDNKMFTRFEFFKPPQNILAERQAKLERKKKFIEHEDEKEELQKKRGKVPEGKWLLKPCIYKRR
ncbi:CYFA0S01e12530g1_1 [Cyberlindnera fabianii]|uniref:Ribosomal RNA-processing protein 8 n=1 Tax=Cyberlindnera fabianii TaxID=36022 RepID=A0A061AQF4_CYBFA|nr:CYFA0S01e12530g1_1 [Cyberlindnera fabianii]